MLNEFFSILSRFPWASINMLSSYFGKNRTNNIVAKYKDKITLEKRMDDILYCSLYPSDYHLVPGIIRRELVRKYAIKQFGFSVLKNGYSPYKNADLIFYNENDRTWYRIWGDMGYLAPESLLIFRHPPIFGSNLKDIIVTSQPGERAEFLKTQVETEWEDCGSGKVIVCDISNKTENVLYPETNGSGSDFEYDISMEAYPLIDFSKKTTPKIYNNTRHKELNYQQIRSEKICKKSLTMSVYDYDLLRYIACNPFLGLKEICLLYSGGSAAENDSTSLLKEKENILVTANKIESMEKDGLLKRLDKENYQNKYILTWQALDLLGAYHSTLPLYMQKYCQWPQIKFEKDDYQKEKNLLSDDYPYLDSHNYYAEKWGENLYEHQKLCREFSNAIITGARTLKAKYGYEVKADDLNTVAANLKAIRYINGVKRIKPIHPDGRFTIKYLDGDVTRNYQIFFEIERNTNSKQVLTEKINNYKAVIPSARMFYKDFDDVVLLFFFDDRDNSRGSVKRKIKMLIEQMKKAGITGYISTYTLASENISKAWSPKYSNFEKEISGGMMLYRKIWYSTESEAWDDIRPLFNISF